MKVKELIVKLQTLNPEFEVLSYQQPSENENEDGDLEVYTTLDWYPVKDVFSFEDKILIYGSIY